MLVNVPISRVLANPWQTRVGEPDGEYIKELALDIAAHGLLQAPMGRVLWSDGVVNQSIGEQRYLLRMLEDGKCLVQLAFGHNRLAAYRWLNEHGYQDLVGHNYLVIYINLVELSDEQMAVLAWSENEKRRDVTAIERARAIRHRIESLGWSNRECAEQLGVDHSTVSNLLRLLKLPDEIQAAILEGRISARQAEAILPIYEAPMVYEVRDQMPGGAQYYARPAGEIVKGVLNGESSDYTRERVLEYFRMVARDLARAEFGLEEWFLEGGEVYCAICKTCDRRMGSRNLCFGQECFVAKTEAHRLAYLWRASEKSGYPIRDMGKGGETTSLGMEGERGRKIVAAGCPNLVLEWSETDLEPGDVDHVAGFARARLVCDKRNHSCTCLKGLQELGGLGSKQDDGPEEVTSAQLDEAARAGRKKKAQVREQEGVIRERLVAYLVELLGMHNVGAWWIVAHGVYRTSSKDFTIEAVFEYLARRAAGKIMGEEGNVANFESVEQMMRFIERRLEEMDIPRLPAEGEAEEFVGFPRL